MADSSPNDPPSAPTGTRGLVAPELLAGLDLLPQFDFTPELLALIRGRGDEPLVQPRPLTPAQQAVACVERFAPGPPGAPDVRVLVYTPPGPAIARPVYLHVHGGGYILGDAEQNDGLNRTTAMELDCVAVSVNYRLAPETTWPGPVEDCYAALNWVYANAEELGVDRTRIAVGGESAGGGHAAALAILARDRGEVPVCLQVLDSPMLDDRTGSASDPHPYCGEFVWRPGSNRFGWRSLLGVEPGGPEVPQGAAPARLGDFSGLPPAFILVGALDLFMEEDIEYARRLMRAGVPTELHVIPGAFHGFSIAGEDAPQVQAARRLRMEALARAFQPG